MFWDNLMSACEKEGVKITPLLKSLGLSSGVGSTWKNGVSPNAEVIPRLAGALNTTCDFLLTGKYVSDSAEITSFTAPESKIISMFRSLDDMHQGIVYDIVEMFAKQAETEQEEKNELEELNLEKLSS